MVRSNWRLILATHFECDPGEWCFVYIQTPDVVDRLSAGIAAKDEEVWFAEYYGVSVASAWCTAYNRYDHPLGGLISVSEIK